MRQGGAVEVPFVHNVISELSMYHCIYGGASTLKQGSDHKYLLVNHVLVDWKANPNTDYYMLCMLGTYVQGRRNYITSNSHQHKQVADRFPSWHPHKPHVPLPSPHPVPHAKSRQKVGYGQ